MVNFPDKDGAHQSCVYSTLFQKEKHDQEQTAAEIL